MTRFKLCLLQTGTLLSGAILIGTVAAGHPAFAQYRVLPAAKVSNCLRATPCIGGSNSGTGAGVLGTSATNDGIDATTTNASNSQRGRSGLFGYDASTDGGTGNNGIAGYSVSGTGGRGTSMSGNGLWAESSDSSGIPQALYAQGDNANTWLFFAENVPNGAGCDINPHADLYCSGSFNAKTVRTRHLTSGGQHVLAYASESASATIEDVGSARLVAGSANVVIDRAFGSTVDRNNYHVFLTPMGDTRGLYVSVKSSAGFEVRESQGGHSTLEFDYRIVARPLDATSDRLPLAPIMKKHR